MDGWHARGSVRGSRSESRRRPAAPLPASFLLLLALAPAAAAQAEALLPDSGLPPAASGYFLFGDVSGDGLTDVLEVGSTYVGYEGTAVRLGQPDGTFGLVHEYPSGAYPRLIADITGDGYADVVAVAPFALQKFIVILPGIGAGTYGQSIKTKVKELSFDMELAAGDLDDDGDLDLLINNEYSGCCVNAYTNLGNGTFGAPHAITVGAYPKQLAVADCTGDGEADILSLIQPPTGGLQVSMAPGDGTGNFGLPFTSPLTGYLGALAAADMDDDGLLDVAIAGHSVDMTESVDVMQGTGTAFTLANEITLVAPYPSAYYVYRLPWIGEVDADGVDDLLVSLGADQASDGGVWFLRGLGDFQFAAPVVNHADFNSPFATPAFADMNADGKIDAVASIDPGAGNVYAMLSYGRGDGSFDVPDRLEVGVGTEAVAAADVDLDGDTDLVVTSEDPRPRVFALLGADDGTFTPQAATSAEAVDEVLLADLTGDGLPDALAWSNDSGGNLALLDGLGDGTFGPAEPLLTGAVSDVAVGDLDLDGLLDVASTQTSLAAVQLQLHPGGSLAPPVPLPAGPSPGGVVLADLSGDGTLDLGVTEISAGTVLVFEGLGGTAFASPQELVASDGPRDMLAADLDGDGDLDLATVCNTIVFVYSKDDAGDGYGYYEITSADVIHRQVAPGSFSDPEIIPTSIPSDGIVATDLDRDSLPELLTLADKYAILEYDDLAFLHGAPGGGWADEIQVRTGPQPSAVAVADLDHDGFDDVAVSQKGETFVRLYFGRSPTWSTLGHALPASSGVPLLSGAGDPVASQLVTITPSLVAQPALGLLFVGLHAAFASFEAGLLVPSSDVVLTIQPGLPLTGRWPAGIPAGMPVYLQAWFQSLTTGEVSASNALVTIAR